MVELRPQISGFYKGLIYCSGIDEANIIAKKLDCILKEQVSPSLKSDIKRGCSEYALSFPLYKEINMLGPQTMNYNKDWKSIEIQYDRAFPSNKKRNTSPTIPGLNLHDCKIMQNWFGYALGIGDKSINSLNENITFSTNFYEKARARLKIHQF